MVTSTTAEPEPAAKRAKKDTPTPSALADVPSDQLDYLCHGHGCGISVDVRHGAHGEADLLTHLSEVRYLLKAQLHCSDQQLLGAALFHSIYGTEGSQGKVLPMSERPKVKALIGEHGEYIAYLNCVMDRATLDDAVSKLRDSMVTNEVDASSQTYTIFSRVELGREEIPLTKAQLQDLMRVHFADWAQQVALYSIWTYRRDAYRNIAATLGGVYASVHSNIMATEPTDAKENLPEMVRARKLGVFDKVMKGEVSYDDLLDEKVPPAAQSK